MSTEAGAPAGEPPASSRPVPLNGLAAKVRGDVTRLLDEADSLACVLTGTSDNPGLALGAPLGGYALAGHDKAVPAYCGSGLGGFGDRVEQLVAGSTGKDGRGILLVVVEDEDPRVLHAVGQPAIRLHLRDRPAGIARLLAGASTEGVG